MLCGHPGEYSCCGQHDRWPSLRSQRCDFVDLVQNGFCVRLVAHQGHDLVLTRPPLQGSFERHLATSPTVSPLRINPPNSFSASQKGMASHLKSGRLGPCLCHDSTHDSACRPILRRRVIPHIAPHPSLLNPRSFAHNPPPWSRRRRSKAASRRCPARCPIR